MPKVEGRCPCGNTFLYYPSAQPGQACSKRCSAIYFPRKPRRGETNPCPICGAAVYANASQHAKGQGVYCSKACQRVAQTKEPVVKACANCGVELVLKPSYGRVQFCSRTCMAAAKTKRPGTRIYNGRPIRYDAKGYVLVWEPDHPTKSFKGWQLEHRLVVERRLGRYLRSDEHVHHVNGVKDDNGDENLEVMEANDHAALSANAYRDRIQAQLDRLADVDSRLAEYERRFGPLDKENP